MSQKRKTLRPIDAPFFKEWHALYMSLYSVRLYVDVLKRWGGYGFRYLLLLIFVLSLPMAIKLGVNFTKFYNHWVIEPTVLTPPLMIQNGELIFDKPMPYVIKNQLGEVVTVIDSTSSIEQMSQIHPHLVLFITKNAISYRTPSPQLFSDNPIPLFTSPPITQAFDKNTNEVFNPQLWLDASHMGMMLKMGVILLYPIMAGALFGFYFVFHLAFTMMAQLVSQTFFHFRMHYKQTCRLLAVSSTPGLTVFFIFYTLNKTFYGFPLLIVALISVYFSFAALSVKRESQSVVRL